MPSKGTGAALVLAWAAGAAIGCSETAAKDATADAGVVQDADPAADGLPAPDAATAETAAPGDSSADATAGDAPAAPNCPACPQGQKCLHATGNCVGAGVIACAPACSPPLVCRLAPPPACMVQSCKMPTGFGDDIVKLTSLQVAAPGASCGGSQGNALGKLVAQLPLVQKLLSDAVQNDQATVLLQPNGLSAAGGTGALRWLFGTRAPQSLKCDPASPLALCSYTASPLCWDPATPGQGPCRPWMELPVAWAPGPKAGDPGALGNTQGVAKPAGDQLQFAIPVADGGQVLLSLSHPVLQATVVTATPGQPAGPLGWRQLDGRLCAAVALADLDAALAGLPSDTLTNLGGLQAARELRAKLLPGDLDLDGDGSMDAASATLEIAGVRAKLAGLTAAP